MSIYLNNINYQLGYSDLAEIPSDDELDSLSNNKMLGDPTVVIPTDHSSKGQIIADIADGENPLSDDFSSDELHIKSNKSFLYLESILNK